MLHLHPRLCMLATSEESRRPFPISKTLGFLLFTASCPSHAQIAQATDFSIKHTCETQTTTASSLDTIYSRTIANYDEQLRRACAVRHASL